MKIEIDLDTIFRTEDGEPNESLEEAVRREVLDRLSGDLRKRLFARLDETLATIMSAQVSEVVKEKMPSLIEDILNVSYTPVARYGDRGTPTTFRNEIVKSIGEQMKYEPKSYGRDENPFTQAVRSIVDAKTDAIKDEITKRVDVQFKEDAIKFAVARLSERLGLSK